MSWFGDFIDWAKEKVEQVIDFFSNLGGRSSYSGTVEEAIDVEKVLNEFKEQYAQAVTKKEKDCVDSVMQRFDDFEKSYQNKYPDLIELLKSKKSAVKKELKNVIIDEFNKRLSVNDPQFRKVLEMKKGDAKIKELESCYEKFMAEAVSIFNSKLETKMNDLNNDISARFKAALNEQKGNLDKKEAEYRQLQDEAQNGLLDLKKLEQQCIPIEDACDCINKLFIQAEETA